jgi:anthranilate phosphoribosyltransferase
MIKEAIEKVVRKTDLSEREMREVFDQIMSGRSTSAQIGAFATALRMKGETVEEITGAARAMREKSVHLDVSGRKIDISDTDSDVDEYAVVDTCGTGGSGADKFNISTTAAFVVAGAGAKVAKHGNRSASSRCGSADVLEALGVKIDVSPDMVQRCILELGIGFLYAPLFHDAMKHALAPRKEIGIRTIFNILGPLSNPANATSQVLGVYDARLTETMAGVLRNLGSKRALVVHGMDGLDEITVSNRTRVTELHKGKLKTYYVTPEKFGLKRSGPDDIRGGSAKENAEIVMSILKGERSARRDAVLMNASAGLVSGFKARDFKEGVKIARESIDSGMALEKLMRLVSITNG